MHIIETDWFHRCRQICIINFIWEVVCKTILGVQVVTSVTRTTLQENHDQKRPLEISAFSLDVQRLKLYINKWQYINHPSPLRASANTSQLMNSMNKFRLRRLCTTRRRAACMDFFFLVNTLNMSPFEGGTCPGYLTEDGKQNATVTFYEASTWCSDTILAYFFVR